MKRNSLTAVAGLIATLCLTAALDAAAAPGTGGTLQALSEDEVADLLFMREEEKLARDSYLEMLQAWGLPIFENIAMSEQRHMDAIENLIEKYGLTDPVRSESVIGQFVDPELQDLFDTLLWLGGQSLTDGLTVGAMIEETDIEDIQNAIGRAEHEDIIETYERLLCGSRNHLRAFVRQIELNGEDYDPVLFTNDELAAIADTRTERGCGFTDNGNGRVTRERRGNMGK